ncbi:hypothetical protein ACS0TY_036398 [Phlomoides rotata]
MSPLFSQTLIRTTASTAYLYSAARPRAIHRLSADAKAVEKIEDVIHTYIVKRSKPDWLPFVPGASYWVPPRRPSYGVAEFVNSLANALTDEEHLSLTSFQGWPSSAFYIHNDTFYHKESTDLLNFPKSEDNSER